MNTYTYDLNPGLGTEYKIGEVPVMWVEKGDLGTGVTWSADNSLQPSLFMRIASNELGFNFYNAAYECFLTNNRNQKEPLVLTATELDDLSLAQVAALDTDLEEVDVGFRRNLTNSDEIEFSIAGRLPDVTTILALAKLTVSPLVKPHFAELETELTKALS